MDKSLANAMKTYSLFTNFSDEELSFLAQYFQITQFSKGEKIMTQGSAGDALYLLEKGSVLVYVTLPGDTQKLATKLAQGQIFGEVTFLTDTPITATIVAESDCICLSCSRKVLNMLHLVCPEVAYKFESNIIQQTQTKIIKQFKEICTLLKSCFSHDPAPSGLASSLPKSQAKSKKMHISQLDYERLRRINFFAKLDEGQLDTLLSVMSARHYERGYYFQFNNKLRSSMSIIYSGAAMMFVKIKDKLIKSIAVCGAGELFLENPSMIFPEFQEYAAYLPSENCTILQLDFVDYQKLQHLHPEIFFHISKEINHHIAQLMYIINRQFVRINCEYMNLIGKNYV